MPNKSGSAEGRKLFRAQNNGGNSGLAAWDARQEIFRRNMGLLKELKRLKLISPDASLNINDPSRVDLPTGKSLTVSSYYNLATRRLK